MYELNGIARVAGWHANQPPRECRATHVFSAHDPERTSRLLSCQL